MPRSISHMPALTQNHTADERVPLKTLVGHIKGVNTVDWSPIYKFVVSGGQDRRVILWNPFSQKPLAQLQVRPASSCCVFASLYIKLCQYGMCMCAPDCVNLPTSSKPAHKTTSWASCMTCTCRATSAA